jgi:bacteriorhodopsin
MTFIVAPKKRTERQVAWSLPCIVSFAYLQMLSDLGVAGLVVELGTHIAEVPPRIGRRADQLNLDPPIGILESCS